MPPAVPQPVGPVAGSMAMTAAHQRTMTPSPSRAHAMATGVAPTVGSRPGAGVPPDAIVLVIPGRKRYHVPGCRQLVGRTHEELTYEEAREEGFTPCTACLPDAALGGVQEPPIADEPPIPTPQPSLPRQHFHEVASPADPPSPRPRAHDEPTALQDDPLHGHPAPSAEGSPSSRSSRSGAHDEPLRGDALPHGPASPAAADGPSSPRSPHAKEQARSHDRASHPHPSPAAAEGYPSPRSSFPGGTSTPRDGSPPTSPPYPEGRPPYARDFARRGRDSEVPGRNRESSPDRERPAHSRERTRHNPPGHAVSTGRVDSANRTDLSEPRQRKTGSSWQQSAEPAPRPASDRRRTSEPAERDARQEASDDGARDAFVRPPVIEVPPASSPVSFFTPPRRTSPSSVKSGETRVSSWFDRDDPASPAASDATARPRDPETTEPDTTAPDPLAEEPATTPTRLPKRAAGEDRPGGEGEPGDGGDSEDTVARRRPDAIKIFPSDHRETTERKPQDAAN